MENTNKHVSTVFPFLSSFFFPTDVTNKQGFDYYCAHSEIIIKFGESHCFNTPLDRIKKIIIWSELIKLDTFKYTNKM